MEGLIGIGIAGLVIGILLAGLFMWIGARLAGIVDATFGKAILAAVASTLVLWIVSAVFSIVPLLGTFVGFIIGLIASLFVIKAIFSTTFGKALLAWIFNIVAQIVAAFLAALIMGGSLTSLM